MVKGKKRRPIGETLGGIIVGFDQQIFRTTPPVQELVAKAEPVRGFSGEDGRAFKVVFPPDAPRGGAAAESVDPTASPGPEPAPAAAAAGRKRRVLWSERET